MYAIKQALSYIKKALLSPEPRHVKRRFWDDLRLQLTIFELSSTAQQLLARWRHKNPPFGHAGLSGAETA